MSDKYNLMVGPDPKAQGGMATWAKSAAAAGVFEQLNIRYIASHIDAALPFKLIRALQCYVQVLFALISGRVNVLHIHVATGVSWWRKWVIIFLAQCFSCPYILHLHGGSFPKYYAKNQNRFGGRQFKKSLAKAKFVLVLSPDWLEWVASVALEANCVVLPNAVEIQTNPKLNSNYKQWLFLGRLSREKGLIELLSATAIVFKQHADIVLNLGGDGDFSWVKQQIADLGLEKNVSVLGWVNHDEKLRCLDEAGLLILPSHIEALPFVILEAMAAHRLVIASQVGGIEWVLESGKAGVLIPPKSHIDLSLALLSAIENPAQSDAIAACGYQRAKDLFSFQKMCSVLKELYA
ncbi:glycosyltransferase family 4 protein [Deefgea rivuli]|uniref:glycosyltransferase family 4 protein n=1 Tax=Deefgea rivuli TaxID=400948 RepID=UPI000484DAEF|nr:glycosyltransferase family 4 protein [Deefgea rivuli]